MCWYFLALDDDTSIVGQSSDMDVKPSTDQARPWPSLMVAILEIPEKDLSEYSIETDRITMHARMPSQSMHL